MKITNNYNLPDPIISAVTGDFRPKEKRISVTTLINPEQLETLRREHFDEIEEDASDRIWLLLGNSVHAMLQNQDQDNALVEEHLEMPIDINGEEWVVSGRSDLLSDGVLTDYKCTSVWSFILGDKKEWEAQLNLYRLLYHEIGFEVNKLQIVAILRDWSKSSAKFKEDYPPVPVHVQPIRLWSIDEARNYLHTRMIAHVQAIKHGIPRGCSDEERWLRGEAWAVKKSGNKRAMPGGVHEAEEDAKRFASEQSVPTEIEHRPGINVRCQDYCPVMPWCEQAEHLGVKNE